MTVLVTTHTKELLSWAVRRVRDQVAAEDLVQDTFLAAFERIAAFRSESQPRTWLYAILNNKIAEYHRMKSRSLEAPDRNAEKHHAAFDEHGEWTPKAAPAEWHHADLHLLDDPEFVAVFEDCLSKLPSSLHACLTAKFFREMSASEICQELGITTTNYWQIIHRAKLNMRACVEQHWFASETDEPS